LDNHTQKARSKKKKLKGCHVGAMKIPTLRSAIHPWVAMEMRAGLFWQGKGTLDEFVALGGKV